MCYFHQKLIRFIIFLSLKMNTNILSLVGDKKKDYGSFKIQQLNKDELNYMSWASSFTH